MSDQKNIKELMQKLISGTITEQEYDALKMLAKENPEIQELMSVHDTLSSAESPIEEPAPEKFTSMRQSVLRSIRTQTVEPDPDWITRISNWIRTTATRPEMAIAAVTLLVGFFLGRIAPVDQDSLSQGLMQQISFIAQENESFKDLKNSPYRYSNIEIREVDANRVALNFDVSTHLEMVREKNDPIVREVIAHSLLNPSHLGAELKAISYSENMLDQKIKEALIFSMHNAPIVAVRQNAMRNLTKYQNDPEIKEAFLTVLKNEESVKMRLVALDYLDQANISPEEVRPYIETESTRRSPAVWIRAQKYLESNYNNDNSQKENVK